MLPAPDSPRWNSPLSAFALGVRSVGATVLSLVLFATYLGVGALANNAGFSLGWALGSTALVWAAPAQIILITSLGSGAAPVQAALAVTISAIRLLPMVAAVIPVVRGPATRMRDLLLPTHFTAVTFWVESFRLLPQVPRPSRVAFCNGLGTGLVLLCLVATTAGYSLAAELPPMLASAMLMLTPLSFLLSTARNAKLLVDRLALALGIAIYPAVAMLNTGVDILISGVMAGTLAFAVHWWRRRAI